MYTYISGMFFFILVNVYLGTFTNNKFSYRNFLLKRLELFFQIPILSIYDYAKITIVNIMGFSENLCLSTMYLKYIQRAIHLNHVYVSVARLLPVYRLSSTFNNTKGNRFALGYFVRR